MSSVSPRAASVNAVSSDTEAARRDTAELVRTRLWGPEHAKRLALLREREPRLADIVLDHGFGEIYADERLTLEQRCIATLACLVTQGKTRQLRSHCEAALRLGIPAASISALMEHLFLYAGLPSTIEGLHVLEDVLNDMDRQPDQDST